MRIFIVYFSLRSNGRKILLKTLAISTGFVIVLSFLFNIFEISDWLGLILNIDLLTCFASIFNIVPNNIKIVIIMICFTSFQKDR